ncbi:fimbrial protein [Caballeronia sp. ATUFL_M2_KS44]|uniref:fimbrial protein n=1 Tax=Caballeronia sp. ATUFL_M2_KS44 TaxID=2921767 RepID=UPI002028DB99|nr:fimbrial protein [Caballeronia sp. ATUFL_M2_KS44]
MTQTLPALAGTILFPSSGAGSLANLAFPASMTISRDAAVGTVLNTQSANVGLSASGVTCDVQKNVTVNGTAISGDVQTFQTNVPGIGVRFYITNGWNGGFVQVPISQTLVSPTGSTAHYTRADIVVTGPVGAGSLTTLPSMTVTFTGSCITTVTTTQYLTTGSAITSNTCSVTTPAIVFNLPKGLSKNLPTVGTTTGDTTLPIGLNCAAGVKVAVTITDATTPLNRTTALSLAQGSSASRVGIQILNGSTPVAFGPDSAVAGNTNQWSAGTASGGVMQIPITARYVRTSATLVPGSVAARATFTMSYQ